MERRARPGAPFSELLNPRESDEATTAEQAHARSQQCGGGNNNNNNNNRKGPNPLTRNYESNGPDVKIRGSAQQIAEKYAQLARDAHSSGDRVMAENYLQHAEHYNRIIAAAQAQMPIQNIAESARRLDDDLDEDRDDSTIRTMAARQCGAGRQRSQANPVRATIRAART